VLPIAGFAWAGAELARLRLRRAGRPGAATLPTPAPGRAPGPAPSPTGRPAAWELLLLLGVVSLVAALVLRAFYLVDLATSGLPASYGALHQLLVALELEGFLLAATVGVQLRLLPSLARTRPVAGWPAWLGLGLLTLAVLGRAAGLASPLAGLLDVANWLEVGAALALFWATGLGRAGLGRTVQAPATLLPGRTRLVLRVIWAGLLAGALGRATGLLGSDSATHAFTSVYLMPLVLVVGLRMLPRVSAYPVRFPTLSGALIWVGLLGGLLRAFGELAGAPAGWQLAWLGGCGLTLALLVFAALVWSPWGVPTGAPRTPEAIAAYKAQTPRH